MTFAAAHGWVNGTMIIPAATAGGLTLGTTYYIHVVSSTSISFHTNVADAVSGSSAVNLTANITGAIIPIGIASTNVYFTPYGENSGLISIFDGTRVQAYTFSEITVALGTLSTTTLYDVFIYDNSGTLTIELVAWASGTARATDITYANGAWYKSGSNTKRYLFTLYTVSTTTTEDSELVRGIWSSYSPNRIWKRLRRLEPAASWTNTNNQSWRQANNSALNQVTLIMGRLDEAFTLRVGGIGLQHTTASTTGLTGIGEDTTVGGMWGSTNGLGKSPSANILSAVAGCEYTGKPSTIGVHTYKWNEWQGAGSTGTWVANSTITAGLVGMIRV